MKKYRSLLLLFSFCIIFTSCGEKETDIVLDKNDSPNKEYIAIVADYSFGALSPKGQKVYISSSDGSEKEEVVFIYGYENTVRWIDDNTLEITVYKVYNENNYIINIMKDKYKDINIIYKKTVSEGFEPGEKWEPDKK